MIPIIAIDVDGTIADLGTAWLNRYNKDYNDNLTNENILSWDTHLYVKPECGKKIYDYLEDSTLYDEVKSIPYAIVAINKIKESCRVIFVTNSTVGASGAKYNWLVKYKFLDRMDDYIECKDKSLILADILIDDRYENCKSFSGVSILYTQPWNVRLIWNGYRLDDWRAWGNAHK